MSITTHYKLPNSTDLGSVFIQHSSTNNLALTSTGIQYVAGDNWKVIDLATINGSGVTQTYFGLHTGYYLITCTVSPSVYNSSIVITLCIADSLQAGVPSGTLFGSSIPITVNVSNHVSPSSSGIIYVTNTQNYNIYINCTGTVTIYPAFNIMYLGPTIYQ